MFRPSITLRRLRWTALELIEISVNEYEKVYVLSKMLKLTNPL